MTTNFLGASVIDFNVRGGFGQEVALDVNLTECNFQVIGFDPPTIGHPALFQHESFEFYGITDTYKRDKSSSGNPMYSVQLTNGQFILGGVELILNDYYGSVNYVPNLINVFGYLENTDGFGGSEVNSAGINSASIISVLNTICNSTTPSIYGSKITYKGKRYKIDLTNLPVLPTYYRINNDNINLLDFIQDICSAGGHDFFIRLNKPNETDITNGWSGTFEVITVSRIEEPVPGRVDEFIANTPCASAKNYGQEVRKDVHSKFVIGANVESLYFNYQQTSGDNSFDGGQIDEAEYANDTILPFFGVNEDNNVIIGYTPSGQPEEYYFNIDIRDIDTPLNTGQYLTCLGELKAAKKGRNSWERYLAERDCNEWIINPNGEYESRFKVGAFAGGATNQFGPVDGFYLLPKYGYITAAQIKGQDYANAIYPTLESRVLSYSNDLVENVYFQRATKLRIPHGWRFAFPRILEGDLYDKASLDETMALIYEESKGRAAILDCEMELLTKENATFASRTEDTSLGNFHDNTTDQLYKRIKGIADTYYNRQFMVSIPFTLGTYEPESNNIRMSQEVTNEGFLDESAWATAYESGLIPDISGINTLLSAQNKFYPFVKYEDCVGIEHDTGEVLYMEYDFSEISDHDKIFNAPVDVAGVDFYDCWVKCRVDEKIYFQDTQTLYGPRAVVELPGPVKENNSADYPSYAKGLFTAFDLAKQPGGIYHNDATVTADYFKNAFDKLGGDDALMHDGESIVYPDLFAIPLRSKLLTYGPWYAIGASGKVTYERNQELNPWNYGGFDAMNQAGLARVQDGITNQTFSEVGSVTVNGAPTFNFGDVLISGGPYVTDISCSFGQNGITTTYSFQAWSSHRALSKLNGFSIERNKRITGSIKELQSNFREGLKNGKVKNSSDFFNKVSNRFIDLNDYNRKDRSSTSHKIFGGEINGLTSNVVTQPLYNAGAQAYTDYANKAYLSVDGLLTPFSTVAKSGWPSFETPTATGESDINAIKINPLKSGNTIQALAYGNEMPDQGLLRSTGEITESGEEYANYRSLGLRLPLIGVGWGYDTDGNPVPSGPDGRFAEDYLYNQSKWKAGPIELKWDEPRGVWTGGTGGAPRIRFTILSAAFTVGFGALGCDHVVVQVNHISCGGTGVQVGDEVNVYDPEYCHFNLPIELLVGLNGTATLMKSENYQSDVDYVVDCVSELRDGGCMWMIDTLCCSEEEIING